MTRQASCACGQLSATCEGDPIRVSICHCHACQRRTGSAFGLQVRFPRERVAFAGESRTWVRVGDEGTRIPMRFCPTCGSTVGWSLDDESVVIAGGAFADLHGLPAPTFSVYEDRMAPWLGIPEDMEHWD